MKFTNCIQNAASRLQDQNGSEERTYDRVRDILNILQDIHYSGKSLTGVRIISYSNQGLNPINII